MLEEIARRLDQIRRTYKAMCDRFDQWLLEWEKRTPTDPLW
jgi:hypothetical protein